MMVSVLRNLRHTNSSSSTPFSALCRARRARPAFQRALADQLAVFEQHHPRKQHSYIDGFVLPLQKAGEAYRDMAEMFARKRRAVAPSPRSNRSARPRAWPHHRLLSARSRRRMARTSSSPSSSGRTSRPATPRGKRSWPIRHEANRPAVRRNRMFWGGFTPLVNTLEQNNEAASSSCTSSSPPTPTPPKRSTTRSLAGIRRDIGLPQCYRMMADRTGNSPAESCR